VFAGEDAAVTVEPFVFDTWLMMDTWGKLGLLTVSLS
jgi:hypothetical protein